jgi:hypothetical protein
MENGHGQDGTPAAELTVAELRAAIGQLLDAVEAQLGPVLRLRGDHYWNVPFGDATNLDDEPVLDLGSVADDADSVREFLSRGDSGFVSIWHESDRIAGVLRAIARLDQEQ